jgi:caffeoyl-CoA O-methyltransferase
MTIEEYMLIHSDEEDKILTELSRETHFKEVAPRMLSGYLQGKFLEFLSKMIQPLRILEIGTFTGYSAICLAKGLRPNGSLHTIEINDERELLIRKYIQKSNNEDKIILHIGDAVDIIPEMNELFDLVFIDGEKSEYPDYYKSVIDKVLPGGFIIADNVLWNNKVIDPTEAENSSTKGIMAFNEMVSQDKRVEKMIIPIRDGLMLIRKKHENLPMK